MPKRSSGIYLAAIGCLASLPSSSYPTGHLRVAPSDATPRSILRLFVQQSNGVTQEQIYGVDAKDSSIMHWEGPATKGFSPKIHNEAALAFRSQTYMVVHECLQFPPMMGMEIRVCGSFSILRPSGQPFQNLPQAAQLALYTHVVQPCVFSRNIPSKALVSQAASEPRGWTRGVRGHA
jgi:hypothetical protein